MATRKLEELPTHGKLLGIDVGSKTLGLALCDATRTIASPHSTLMRSKWKKDQLILQKLIDDENICALVVGLPLNMDGEKSAQTRRAEEFAKLAEEAFGLPLLLWDERLTTQAAEAAMFEQRTGRQTRASKKDIKQNIDSVAAALILQGVVDALL